MRRGTMVPCSVCFCRSECSILSHPDFLNSADRSEPMNRTCSRADECGSSPIRTAETCRHFRTQRLFWSPPLRISLFISASYCKWMCIASASIAKTIIFLSMPMRGQLVNWLSPLNSGLVLRSRGRSDFSHFLRRLISSEAAASFGNSSAQSNNRLRNGKTEF
jgi:hypothetical protein